MGINQPRGSHISWSSLSERCEHNSPGHSLPGNDTVNMPSQILLVSKLGFLLPLGSLKAGLLLCPVLSTHMCLSSFAEGLLLLWNPLCSPHHELKAWKNWLSHFQEVGRWLSTQLVFRGVTLMCVVHTISLWGQAPGSTLVAAWLTYPFFGCLSFLGPFLHTACAASLVIS